MKVEFKTKYGDTVSFNETEKLKEKVYQMVLKYFKDEDMFFGEGIMQDDDCLINAPEVFADICDQLFKFKYTEND